MEEKPQQPEPRPGRRGEGTEPRPRHSPTGGAEEAPQTAEVSRPSDCGTVDSRVTAQEREEGQPHARRHPTSSGFATGDKPTGDLGRPVLSACGLSPSLLHKRHRITTGTQHSRCVTRRSDGSHHSTQGREHRGLPRRGLGPKPWKPRTTRQGAGLTKLCTSERERHKIHHFCGLDARSPHAVLVQECSELERQDRERCDLIRPS